MIKTRIALWLIKMIAKAILSGPLKEIVNEKLEALSAHVKETKTTVDDTALAILKDVLGIEDESEINWDNLKSPSTDVIKGIGSLITSASGSASVGAKVIDTVVDVVQGS